MPVPDIFDLPIHPVAALFPKLDEDELHQLAAHIKAHGLQQPLVVGEHEGQPALIDGINRRDACRIAGITPATVPLNGADPIAYILGANIHRRHLSKGQQAMITLFFKNNLTQEQTAENLEVSQSRIGYAATVIKHAPDLVNEVISGALALNDAYNDASARKKAKQGREWEMERLRKQAPDLADRVADEQEKLTIDEARVLLESRNAAEANQRETVLRLSEGLYRGGTAWAVPDFAVQWLKDTVFCKLLIERLRLDPTEISNIQKGAQALAAALTQITKGAKKNV